MPGVIILNPAAVFQDPNAQQIHSDATIVASGEAIVTGYGATEVTLFVNVKAAPTGTSPTLQYTIREVDPGDGVTPIGPSVSSTSITGIGIQKISLVAPFGGSIAVTWIVTGAGASFTQVYATMVGKDSSVALVDITGVAISSSNPLRTDPTGTTTQPVSGTVTANQGTAGSHIQRWMMGLSDGSGFISPATDRSTAAGPFSVRLSDGTAFYDAPTSSQLPAALVGSRLDTNLGAWLGSTAPTVGQKTMASSVPVVFASDQSPLSISIVSVGAATGLQTGTVTLGGGTANTLNVIRATVYNEPAVAAQRSIASSSASDTNLGVGARQVSITYYDNTGAGPFTEIVILNGVTAVATVASDIRFIESMIVISVGSTGRNVGTVTLFVNNVGGGGTIGTIGIGNLVTTQGDNRTLWAHHYVASGKTASFATLVVSAISFGSGTNATFFLRSQSVLTANSADVTVSDLLLVVASQVRALGIPIKVTGFARVTAFGVPGINNATLSVSLDFSEV